MIRLMTQKWSPGDYQRNAAFVPALGASLLSDLDPQPGERILDLGCGDGVLTLEIAASGATVVGVDASPEMVEAAKQKGIDARLADARALPFQHEFDAVFSNAVLHWIREPDLALAGIARALRPGGRLIAEFGGHTNVAAISVAIRAVFARRGVDVQSPWDYPTPNEYRVCLERQGFEVERIAMVPRPTPLPAGMDGWLRTFCVSQFAQLPPDSVGSAEQEIVELLRPSLCDSSGQWTADYVRLRLVATLPRAES